MGASDGKVIACLLNSRDQMLTVIVRDQTAMTPTIRLGKIRTCEIKPNAIVCQNEDLILLKRIVVQNS